MDTRDSIVTKRKEGKSLQLLDLLREEFVLLNRRPASKNEALLLMTQALEMLPDDASGRIAFYMNDTIRSVLRRQMQNKDNAFLTWAEIAGRKVLSYGDTPIHKLGSDVIGNTGNALTFS